MGFLEYYRDKVTIRNIILALAAKKKQVVYGAQSVNMQLPRQLNKETKDYDILTSKSKGAAEELASELNKEWGSQKFVVTAATHPGTYKVRDTEGNDIADYTQITKKPKSVAVLGIRYAGLGYQKGKIKRALKDEASSFRWDKDRDTLRRIQEGTKKIW